MQPGHELGRARPGPTLPLPVATETAGALLRAGWRPRPSHSPVTSTVLARFLQPRGIRYAEAAAAILLRAAAELPCRCAAVTAATISPSSRARPEMEVAAAAGGEDCLVEIHPSELRFLFEVKKQSSCSIHLANRSNHYVAFKVKTTSPKKYCVRPNVRVILPRSSRDFTDVVTMQEQKTAPPNLQIKDKFLLQTTVVPLGTADEDIVPAFFSKETGRYIEENKLRVVLVSATQPQVERLITGAPDAKAIAQVPMAEEILVNMNEVPNVVTEIYHPLQASCLPIRETPAILSEIPSPVKENPILRDFLVPSKEAPFTSTDSSSSLKESPAVSVESHFCSTETSATLKEFPPLENAPAPRGFATLSQGLVSSENRHLSHVAEDVQDLQSKLNHLEAKLEEAETLILKLREETRTTIEERDKLQKEMVFLRRAGTVRIQAGFPMLFVLYMAFVGMSLGYMLHLF